MCNSQPKTPDPYAVADAQGKANVDAATTTAALNRPDQITPWGNQTWTTDPNDPTKSTSTITLAPEQQALLDQQNQTSLGLGAATNSALGRVQDTFSTGIDVSQLPGRMGVADALNQSFGGANTARGVQTEMSDYARSVRNTGLLAKNGFDTSLGTAMPAVNRIDLPGQYSTAAGANPNYTAPAGNVPTYQGPTQSMPQAGGYTAEIPQYLLPEGEGPQSNDQYRSQIQDALYAQQTSRLDPRFKQQGGDMEARLAAQGITQGSEAYNREMQNFGMEKNDAYSQAMNQAILTGETAVQGQYGRDLSSRQQKVGESDLDFKNRMSSTQMSDDRVDKIFQQQLALRQQSGAESGQAFNADMASRQQTVGESDLDFQNRMASRNQVTNEGLNEYQARLAGANQNLSAEDMWYQNSLDNRRQVSDEYTTAQGTALNAGNLALNAQDSAGRAQTAAISDAASGVGMYDNARAQMLAEEMALRGQDINELNALRSGAQVTNPQFSSGQSGATVNAAPVADSIWNSYNGQVANNSALMGGVSQLGGSLLTAAGAAGGFAPLMAGL